MICSLAVSRVMRLRPWRLIFAALLVLPPCARLWLDRPEAVSRESPSGSEALKIELESLRSELRAIRSELEAAATFKPSDRYEIALGQLIPLSDPSPSRSILWAHVGSGRAVPVDSAAIWKAPGGSSGEPGVGQALVGRVISSARSSSIVRIQTLHDPEFRVRFKHRGASGILFGTPRVSDGLPILEIRHLSELLEFKEGEAVLTEGHDGVYPEDLLIGYVEREGSSEPSLGAEKGHLRVRAAVSPAGLSEVAITIDRAAESLTDLRRRSSGQGGSQ